MKWMSIEVVAQQHIQVTQGACVMQGKVALPQELNIMQYHEVNRFVRCILSSNCGLWNKRCSLDYLRRANRFPLVSFVDGK